LCRLNCPYPTWYWRKYSFYRTGWSGVNIRVKASITGASTGVKESGLTDELMDAAMYPRFAGGKRGVI
jgi:hypothetical protein